MKDKAINMHKRNAMGEKEIGMKDGGMCYKKGGKVNHRGFKGHIDHKGNMKKGK